MDTKLILVLLFFTFHSANSTGFFVNQTLVKSDAGAVCLTGKPASYYLASGFDKGIHNWLIFLPGGGWCATPHSCIRYAHENNITEDNPAPFFFNHILSNDKETNPDFYNWNKVMIKYCDGSSFTGDSQTIYNGTNLYFRGARIFNATMQELLHKGMKMAQNALLVGDSAGGVATTIHCDEFHNLLASATRVKCFSDAGYFFSSKKFKDQHYFLTQAFQGLIRVQRSTKSLPKSCTTRLSPDLCFFAQNLQKDIQTPIFFLMSAFDSYQVQWTFSSNKTIQNCFINNNCSIENIKILQDLRLEFLSLLPKKMNSFSRGVLITSSQAHGQTRFSTWELNMVINGRNETISKIFGDWYFDRRVVHIIDNYSYPCPNKCSVH